MPNEGFVGEDSFLYSVSDGELTSEGIILITVTEILTPTTTLELPTPVSALSPSMTATEVLTEMPNTSTPTATSMVPPLRRR